jgi:hypothetical protein
VALPIDDLNRIKLKDEINVIGAIKENNQKWKSNIRLNKI